MIDHQTHMYMVTEERSSASTQHVQISHALTMSFQGNFLRNRLPVKLEAPRMISCS